MQIAAYPTHDWAADLSRFTDFAVRDARKASREFAETYQVNARRVRLLAQTRAAQTAAYAAAAVIACGGAFAAGATIAATAATAVGAS